MKNRVVIRAMQWLLWGKIFISFLILCLSVNSYAVTHIRLITDAYTPLQYQENGVVKGYVHEYLREVIKRVNRRYPIEIRDYQFYPWKRAIAASLKDPNVVFFSLSRTPSREGNYEWLGTVSDYRQSFFKLKDKKDISIDSFNDIVKKNYLIGLQNGSATHDLIKEVGFVKGRDFILFPHYSQGIKMLYSQRIDLIPLTDTTARISACRLGFDGDRLEAVFAIDQLAKPLWAVLSKNSDPQLVKVFREEMQAVKDEGVLKQLSLRYISLWSNRPCSAI